MSNKSIARLKILASQFKSIRHHQHTMATASTATASNIQLTPSTQGTFHVSHIPSETYGKASQLLQKNHDDFHIYFNEDGFHNHIAHHLLTIFALGATPGQVQKAYDDNAHYQRSQFQPNPRNIESMTDPKQFSSFLNNEKYFRDYELFFQNEISEHGWPQTLNKHLFARTEHSEDLLIRMFAGFYHPIIHLGFGVEFQQPPIIAEALAQGAIHDSWPSKFLTTTASKARAADKSGTKQKSMLQLILDARSNTTIRESAQPDDANKVRDGVFKRAFDETSDLSAQWRVPESSSEDELEKKTAEMVNVCAYFAAASQHPSHQKKVKYDFFYMHAINASIFYSAFLSGTQPQGGHDAILKKEDYARILEYKAWSDISMYISRGSPELFKDEITNYKPKNPSDGWAEIFERVDILPDDGHASKLVRAIANGEKICKKYDKEDSQTFPVQGDMWLQMAHMAVDSVEDLEGNEGKWVRNAGFDQAWVNIPQRK